MGLQLNMQRNGRSWLLLIFLGVLWGVTFSLAKMSTEGGAHPIGINYWCCLIGAAILISGSFIFRRPLPLRRDVLIVCTVCGVLGSVIPGIAYFYAASHVSPGVLAITIATVPLITFLAAAILGVERISITRLLGVFLGILSIALLIGRVPVCQIGQPYRGYCWRSAQHCATPRKTYLWRCVCQQTSTSIPLWVECS